MLRIVIADDHTMVREALRLAFERAGFAVVGEAADGEEAVAKVEHHQPDVVLIDLSLPVLSGIEAVRRITDLAPSTAVVVLSMLSDETAVSSALDAGARGYLVKDCTTAEIVDSVTRVAAGDTVLSGSASVSLAGVVSKNEIGGHRSCGNGGSLRPRVSKREEEVLRVMATGVSIPEAAGELFISVKTVKNHLSSIYGKLDSHDRAQAVLKAMRMGLIQLH
ncbi:MAG TPA: response regulator transcription factor [Acidimicrobiales bacterium]|nr:response regulator transcription factor [Acidimicrobiales bacterium]